MSIPVDPDDQHQENFELVECDEETANNYLAMVEMKEDLED